MPTIKKTRSGRYTTQLYVGIIDGKRQYRRITSDSKAELRQIVEDSKEIDRDPMTFENAMKGFIESKNKVLSPNTLRIYEGYLNADYPFRLTYIEKINQKDLQQWVNDFSVNHAPKTTKNVYGFVKAVLRLYRPHFEPFVKLPINYAPEIEIPSEDEIKALISNCTDKELKLAIMLASCCSLRRAEISALCYEDIKKDQAYIHRSLAWYDGEWVEKGTKTASSTRYVDVPQKLLDEIGKGKGRIITLTPDKLTNRFIDYCKRLGIPRYHFHSLRHFWASSLINQGCPLPFVQKAGGWQTDATPRKIYIHCMKDKKPEQIKYFSTLLG